MKTKNSVKQNDNHKMIPKHTGKEPKMHQHKHNEKNKFTEANRNIDTIKNAQKPNTIQLQKTKLNKHKQTKQ